jgi:ABC-type Zn uptake system ZnuABC Zn-binding protein ZnuA
VRRVILFALLGFLPVSLATVGCGSSKPPVWPDRPGPKVAVSFPPYYSLAANVAGDDAVVKTVMSDVGPHHFNGTDQEARILQSANLLFINGLNLDNTKIERLMVGAANKGLKLIDLGSKLDKKTLLEGVCNHDHGPGEVHDHGIDPHVWLGLNHAITMVGVIRDELKQIDPDHAAGYDRRAAEYIAKLEKLRADGLALLKDKKERTIVTSHDSLNYFADTFKLQIGGVVQLTAGQEPNQTELETLTKKCIDHKLRVITVEPQYAISRSGQAVLGELKRKGLADAVLVEIDPLETAREQDLTPDWYEKKMRANLEALAGVLK